MFYKRSFTLLSLFTTLCPMVSHASEPAPLVGRAEVNWRYGSERSILMSEFWVPFLQDGESVLYGDARLMGDDQDNNEFNLGLGYREIVDAPLLGRGVAGVHGWFDRRITARGSTFHQATLGAEWLGEEFDILANTYIPLSSKQRYSTGVNEVGTPYLAGTGIFVERSTAGEIVEEPQGGFDIEFGWQVPFAQELTDSARIYGGGYYFEGDESENIAGWRTRLAVDVTSDIQIGGRFQRDDERGSQGFLEATVRFPFGQKKSFRDHGLYARLDDSPERDIDIVTGDAVVTAAVVDEVVPVLNVTTGEAQVVRIVDNSAGGGGDGSIENPYNQLSNAQDDMQAYDIIYIKTGDGGTTGQNQGLVIDEVGVQVIGQGRALMYNADTFEVSGGGDASNGTVLIAAGAAPHLTNVNADEDIITVTADNVTVSDLILDGSVTARDGLAVLADGGTASAQNVIIRDVVAQDNERHGIYIYASNGGSASALVQGSTVSGNDQHGLVVYDDTAGTFTVDLGGGALGSTGNNVLAGNTLEDLAVEYDGAALSAQNNWWGQASGADTDNPETGIDPQIYYGAPINDGLVGHWTFDTEWISNTTAYDRSGNNNDGTLQGGLSVASLTPSENRQGLAFTGNSEKVLIPSTHGIDLGTQGFTIITRINRNNAAERHDFVAWKTGSDDLGLFTFGTNPTSYLRENNVVYGNPASDATNLNAGTDYVVALTRSDAGVWSMQVNDSAPTIGATNAISLSDHAGIAIQIGRNDTAFTMDGVIDDTRIYTDPLSSAHITEIYRMDTSSSVDTSNHLTASP